MDRKPGVYLCEGCGIAEAVSVDDLEQVASGELKVPACKRHAAFCSEEGVALIAKDIESGEVNQPIIVACSPRVMTDRFTFPDAQVIRANLREQVIWTQPPGEEDTQALAADNLRMAVAQAKNSDPPVPHGEGGASRKLLVVGGGVSGLTAAREAARMGVEVILVEKGSALGGWARKWSRTIPHRPPYRDPQPNGIGDLIAAVEADPAVTVMTGALVTRTAGGPGDFTVTLSQGGKETSERVGAIVVATGWRGYDIARHEYLGYGTSPDIVTDIEFEELLANGGIKRKSDGAVPSNLAFIIPGDSERMPYSSGVSDRVAIKQALQVIEAVPDAMVYVIYEDLRAHGTAEEFYRQGQEAGIIFQKGRVKSVAADLTVTLDDDLLGQEVPLSGLDMVVLSTGMVPNSTNVDLSPAEEGADQLADDIDPAAPVKVARGNGEDEAEAAETSGNGAAENGAAEEGGEPALPGGPILNLQYRQGPHLPILAHGFADSHFICFPYETRRSGIYTCGPVRRAMTIADSQQDAQGAVLKAIQAMRAADASTALHPRVGDLSFPEFGLDICTKCRRCTVECPFGAIDEQDDGYPVLNATRCRRCGTCMGACPVRTISFKNYSAQMVADMIKAVEVPDEFEEKPRILVFACENDAYPALDMAGINRHRISPYIRIVPVRCLGSVTMLWISTALECGYDGVMLMGCKTGDDYQCHFVKGSGIAQERMAKVGETLKSLALEEERVQVEEVSIADSGRVAELLNSFAGKIDEIGLNPFKGF
ncbi:MAG: hydrogenase iron-sulfur subunit [Kiloniellales bacterium]